MSFQLNQRVRVRSGEQGVIVGQPDSDPVVAIDGSEHVQVFYRSEVRPIDPT